MVMEYFNNLLYTYDRIGGEQVHLRETEPLVECLANNGLTDLKSKGCCFTWVRRV